MAAQKRELATIPDPRTSGPASCYALGNRMMSVGIAELLVIGVIVLGPLVLGGGGFCLWYFVLRKPNK